MLRFFCVLAFGLFLAGFFGTSLTANQNDPASRDLVKLDSSNLNRKINELDTKIQGLTNRMNHARVSCVEKTTGWEPFSDAYIKYLDRHNVECPYPYYLARFRLVRQGNYAASKIRYLYRCCKFIL